MIEISKEIRHVMFSYSKKGKNAAKTYRRNFAIGGTRHHVSCQEIAEALNINHMTVWNYLKSESYQKKLDVWVTHELTLRNLIYRITICKMLLKRIEIEPFLKKITTGDRKWVKYENIKRKCSWSKADDPSQTISKPDCRQTKLCSTTIQLCSYPKNG